MSQVNIIKALIQAESKMDTPRKDAVNPHFNSKYSTLQEVLRCIKPALTRNGLRLRVDIIVDEKRVGAKVILQHVSGEVMEHEPVWMPICKSTPQGVGSASTYAQRYAICAAFAIAGEDDDDANAAEPTQKSKTTQKMIVTKTDVKKESTRSAVCTTSQHKPNRTPEEKREAGRKYLMKICRDKGLSDEYRLSVIKQHTGKSSSTQLSVYEIVDIIKFIEQLPDLKTA